MGIIYLILSIVLFVFFNFDSMNSTAAFTAVNLSGVLWTALPAAFWIRCVVLAFSTQSESALRRTVCKVLALCLFAVMAVSVITGHMLKFQHFDENAADLSQSEPAADEEFSL